MRSYEHALTNDLGVELMVMWIALGVVVVSIVIAALALFETAIVIDPGTIALVLKRGKATGRALTPGRHFIQPWRKVVVQVYPSRELSFVAGGRATSDPRVEYVDDPLRVHLGDKAFAQVSYTLRCQLDTGKLKDVHNQYGPEGLWPALRDVTRAAVLAEVGNGKLSIGDVYGDGFTALEQRLGKSVGKALGAIGFELKMFNLREVDLGETGEVIQATVRADAELEREHAFAKVRKARLENDAAIGSLLDGVDGDVLLRYRQIEAWRDILHRWNGTQPIPPALTTSLAAADVASAANEAEHHVESDLGGAADEQQ